MTGLMGGPVSIPRMPPPEQIVPASTTGEKILALGTFATTNGFTAAAPLLPSNTSGSGGPEVNIIAGFINAVIQALKMSTWFNQNTWAMWTICALAMVISLAIWAIWLNDPLKGILNGMAATANAMTNYAPLHTLKILPAGIDAPLKTEGEPTNA